MKYLVWPLLGLLVVLNQDYWQWDRTDLVWGFLPYTLVHQVGVSLGAAAVWLLAVSFCWPRHLEDFEPQPEPDEDPPPGGDAA